MLSYCLSVEKIQKVKIQKLQVQKTDEKLFYESVECVIIKNRNL